MGKAKKVAKPKAPITPKATPPGFGVSRYAGKTLIPNVKLEESRRISGSTRYKSLALITAAGTKGISFEEYRKAKGASRYVGWFLKRDHILVK